MRDFSFLCTTRLDQLYDAAFEGDYFQATLDLVIQQLPDAVVLLYGQDTARISGNFLIQRGLSADATRAFGVDLADRNPWFEGQWRHEVGHVYRDGDILDRETLVETKFYKEWLSKWGALDHAAGFVIARSGTRQLVLEVRYTKRQEPHLRSKVKECLEYLAPHIVRAARISDIKVCQSLEENQKSSLLELLAFPVFVIDPECRVHGMNTRAEALAGRMESVLVSADGTLHAIDPGTEAELTQNVRDVSAGSKRRVSLMSVASKDKPARQFLSICRLGNAPKSGGTHCGLSVDHGTRLAVVAQDLTQPLEISHEALWRTYGLSSREAELAISLLGGDSVGDFASKSSVSKQTLRNQLCGIMRKTDTSRQPELVALLTRIAISNSC